MHSIINFCLCVLFLAIECTEASDREAEEKIRFVPKSDSEILKIKNNDNLKTIHDLGEKLVKTIKGLSVPLDSIEKRVHKKELSISINETGNESSIDTNEKNHNDYKLSDIVDEIKERSLADTLGSFHKKWRKIEIIFFGKDSIFSSHRKNDEDRDEIFLSKESLNNLIDVFKVVEIISWYLCVKWIDTPSDADNDKRKSILATIAQIDLEWRKNWNDLLSEIHKLSNDTPSGHDGAVLLDKDILSEFHSCLLSFYCVLFLSRSKMNNEDPIVIEDDSETECKNFPPLFCTLESMCTDNKYANASIQLEVRESSSNSTAGTTSTEDVTNPDNPDDAQKTKKDSLKDMA